VYSRADRRGQTLRRTRLRWPRHVRQAGNISLAGQVLAADVAAAGDAHLVVDGEDLVVQRGQRAGVPLQRPKSTAGEHTDVRAVLDQLLQVVAPRIAGGEAALAALSAIASVKMVTSLTPSFIFFRMWPRKAMP